MRPGQSETHPSSRALLHIPSRSSHHSLSHPSSCVSKTVSMILKKDSLKMKAFIETGHQEGKQNTWCSLKTLCTSMSCLEYCPLSNPMFCSKPMSSSVANILVHVLSLPPVQRLSVRSHPLGPFEQLVPAYGCDQGEQMVPPLVTKPGGSAERVHRNAICSSTDL